jgi:mRNA interferase RelE/StbE
VTGAGGSRRNAGAKTSARKSERHPYAASTVVRLTEPAFADLVALNKANTPALRWVLKKLLLLEKKPLAGEALRGPLIGYRKITVSDRTWRVVWRVTHDERGNAFVDVAEVWAVGARSDAEVYDEMVARVTQMPDSPTTLALAQVVERLGKAARDITPAREPDMDPLPPWLIDNLMHQAGMRADQLVGLTLREAVDLWTEWMSQPRP